VTFAVGYVLFLLVVALVLFASDQLSVDVVGLIVLLALAVPRVLSPKEALAGFANDTILLLISLFVLTAGIVRTGVVERVGLWLASVGGKNPAWVTRVILVAVVAVSSFLSNTVTTAVFLPIMIGVARRAGTALSRVLMPLAFASILAGSVTLIGTSTNLVVSSQLPRYGLAPIGFFELTAVGLGITVIGLLYLMFVAPRLVPDRGRKDMTDRYDLRRYLSEAIIGRGSRFAGKTLVESQLGSAMNLNVVGIVRDGSRGLAPGPNAVLREDDVLLIEGKAEDILSLKDAGGIEIRADVKPTLSDSDLQSEKIRMMEAMVLPRSAFAGRTLRESRFRERTGLAVLAIHSAGGADLVEKLSRTRLHESDVLLLQGSLDALDRVRAGSDLLLLEDVSAHHPRRRKAPLAAAIFVATIVVGVSGLLPLVLAFLAGGLSLVLTGCLRSEEAYDAVDWRLMVMIGCMIGFGVAMEKTGAANYVSELVVRHVSGFGPLSLLAAFFLFTVLLTQPMSNQAAALVVLPVAIAVSRKLELNPRAFVMAVTFAASCSFLTPLEPSCVLVYGPGRYRFFDFARVGFPLTLLVFLFSMLLIPVFWPFGG
jgi:di/tricarboxylate transporter